MPIFVALALACAPRDLPPLIPREALFASPERTAPQISPDGQTIAYLRQRKEGGYSLWLRSLTRDADHAISDDDAASYTWSADSKRILFFKPSGDENRHLYSIDLATRRIRDLTPFEGVRAQNPITAPKDPGEVLIGLNLRDPHRYDMYRVDLETGAIKLDTVNPGDVLSWNTDQRLNIRACSAINPEDASTAVRTRASASAPWKTVFKAPFEESLEIAQEPGGTSVVGFNASGRSLFVVSAKGTDRSRLLRLDASTGRIREEVTKTYGADIEILPDSLGNPRFAVIADPDLKRVEAVGYNYQKLEWKVMAPACQADFDALAKFHDGVFRILGQDSEDRKWLIEYTSDIAPTAYAVFDRKSKVGTLLFEDRPDLRKYSLAPVQPFSLRARDDTKLIAYLTLPTGMDAKKLPLVLYPHPGAWGRDRWQFDPVVQLLANRGYAVLQVNARGSVGYGLQFLNDANGGWGIGAMQNDLTDAVHWVIAHGIADPARIAVLGGQYGGYAALAGLAFTPELYCCAVDMVGPSDVGVLRDTLPEDWGPSRTRWIRRVGLDSRGIDFVRRISPLYHVSEMHAPLLIGQGANDPRVKLANVEQIVGELRKLGGQVTFVVYPDEAHNLGRPENNLDFFGRAEEFLGKYLGGRAEPFQEIAGSSAQLH
ncbi:MAG TPA: S9 family peptidase [Fimbriimonadaceae bacterium]|nr:S9 family peptidase [Fimbriimonadaceae bacterium]